MSKRKTQPTAAPQHDAEPQAAAPASAPDGEPQGAPETQAAADAPPPAAKTPRPESKLAQIVEKLLQPDGVTLAEIGALTGWQEHSIRGALAGTLKKKFGLTITSEKTERGRVYKAAQPAAQP